MSRLTHISAVLIALVVVGTHGAVLAAQAPGTPASVAPHDHTFANARANATSDFERAVLADNLITYAEYQEAANRFIACMTDAGEVASTQPDPDVPYAVLYVQHLDTMIGTPGAEATIAAQDQVFETCAKGTVRIIDAVFRAVLTNPEDEDMSTITVVCLQRQGLAPDTYGPQEFEANFVRQEGTPPLNPSDPRFGSCINNPNQTGLPLQMVAPDPRMLPANATPTASPTA